MKLSQAIALSISTGLLAIGCSKGSDITSKAIESHLASDPGKEQCSAKAVSLGSADVQRVRITENSFGELSGIQSMTAQELRKGRKLVVTLDELCLYERRSYEGREKSPLLRSIKIKEAQLAPARSHLIQLSADMSFQDLADLVDQDSCIRMVGENVKMQTTQAQILATPSDPKFSSQKHMPNIKAAEAYDKFYAPTVGISKEVVIAIIDSGVDLGHEDLRANSWVNSGEVAGNGRDDDSNGYVDDINGYNFASKKGDPSPEPWSDGGQIHGTHVAGLSAAVSNNSIGIAGVMGEKAKIMALNVFGKVAGADTPNIDEAIRYAADMGADVINMSLGGTGRAETTAEAIRYAVSKGVVVIVAAGNSNVDINSQFFTPASYGSEIQGMLAIGAVDAATSARCSFSNYNTTRVEMAAPGCGGLYSTVPGNAYKDLQGTSMEIGRAHV